MYTRYILQFKEKSPIINYTQGKPYHLIPTQERSLIINSTKVGGTPNILMCHWFEFIPHFITLTGEKSSQYASHKMSYYIL